MDPETLRCIAVWRLAPYRQDPSFTSTIFRMDANSLGMAAIDSWPPVHCVRRPRAGSILFASFGAGYLTMLVRPLLKALLASVSIIFIITICQSLVAELIAVQHILQIVRELEQDERAGSIVSCWKGHKELVSSLLLHPEQCPETMLITASHDRFLSLWDTRMNDITTSWTAATAQSRIVGSLKLSGAISCMDQYQDNVFCAASGRLTLVNLQSIGKPCISSSLDAASSAAGGGGEGNNRDASSSVSQLSFRGIASLGIMKHSKLLVVGQEDGMLKIVK